MNHKEGVMPREQINYPDQHNNWAAKQFGHYRASELDPPIMRDGNQPMGTGPYLEPTLHVAWNNIGGWVQINLDVDRDGLREHIRSDDEAVAEGRQGASDTLTVCSATLSPSEIDAMIQYLKRAKRKAFTPSH